MTQYPFTLYYLNGNKFTLKTAKKRNEKNKIKSIYKNQFHFPDLTKK